MSFWHTLSSGSLWVIVLNNLFYLCVCSPPLKLPHSDYPHLSLVFFPYSYAVVLCFSTLLSFWDILLFVLFWVFFILFLFPGHQHVGYGQHMTDTILCPKFESWLTVSQGIWETVSLKLVFLLDLEHAQCPCRCMLLISSDC